MDCSKLCFKNSAACDVIVNFSTIGLLRTQTQMTALRARTTVVHESRVPILLRKTYVGGKHSMVSCTDTEIEILYI